MCMWGVGGLIIVRANAKWRPFNHQTAVDTEDIFTQCKGGVPRALIAIISSKKLEMLYSCHKK